MKAMRVGAYLVEVSCDTTRTSVKGRLDHNNYVPEVYLLLRMPGIRYSKSLDIVADLYKQAGEGTSLVLFGSSLGGYVARSAPLPYVMCTQYTMQAIQALGGKERAQTATRMRG
jgi:hypothetical protein